MDVLELVSSCFFKQVKISFKLDFLFSKLSFVSHTELMLMILFKSSQVGADSNAIATKIDDKFGDVSTHSLDEVSGMMRGTISLYEAKVWHLYFL